MIAHVAEQSEGSGRVLFWLEPEAMVSPRVVEGAARLAAAFGSEIETIVVDDGAAARASQLDVSRVVAMSRPPGPRSEFAAQVRSLELAGQRQRRTVEQVSARLGVPCHHTISAGDAIDQLTGLCLMTGPWNVIAIGRETSPATALAVAAILANVSGATGVVVAGRGPASAHGPVAVIAEELERLPSMLRVASRLTKNCEPIHLFPVAETRGELMELESQARLLCSGRADVVFERVEPTLGIEGTLDDRLRRLAPVFAVARFGGTLLPASKALARTVALTGAPFLLVR